MRRLAGIPHGRGLDPARACRGRLIALVPGARASRPPVRPTAMRWPRSFAICISSRTTACSRFTPSMPRRARARRCSSRRWTPRRAAEAVKAGSGPGRRFAPGVGPFFGTARGMNVSRHPGRIDAAVPAGPERRRQEVTPTLNSLAEGQPVVLQRGRSDERGPDVGRRVRQPRLTASDWTWRRRVPIWRKPLRRVAAGPQPPRVPDAVGGRVRSRLLESPRSSTRHTGSRKACSSEISCPARPSGGDSTTVTSSCSSCR